MDYTTQGLINSGMAWSLEGYVGRACMAAIESGRAILGREPHRDYWGNYVPSRYQVEPGTKGSLLYANDIRLDNHLPLLTEDGFDAGQGDDWDLDDVVPQCDYCGEEWEDGGQGEDWNGDTGCHFSCEAENED